MNNAYLVVSFVVTSLTLLGIVYGLVTRGHKLASKFEDMIPTLERIAKAFPGRQLERHLESIERAIDLQSQELQRIGRIVDRRRDTPAPYYGADRRSEAYRQIPRGTGWSSHPDPESGTDDGDG